MDKISKRIELEFGTINDLDELFDIIDDSDIRLDFSKKLMEEFNTLTIHNAMDIISTYLFNKFYDLFEKDKSYKSADKVKYIRYVNDKQITVNSIDNNKTEKLLNELLNMLDQYDFESLMFSEGDTRIGVYINLNNKIFNLYMDNLICGKYNVRLRMLHIENILSCDNEDFKQLILLSINCNKLKLIALIEFFIN